EQPPPRLLRGVEPRRQDRRQGELPVHVVEPVGHAVVPRKEKEAEPNLRDQHRLCKREELRGEPRTPCSAPVGDRARDHGEPRDGQHRVRDGSVRLEHGTTLRRYPSAVVEEGKPAPDFELSSETGERVRLSELRGKPVVLYFYPRDDTPG